mmetsp:Transcript_56005/g.114472  ORF Transcript_56005/g.114472 Transcript_56005/m.114472 type:complete len:251 (+) Transcript_56005:1109-1861(+)
MLFIKTNFQRLCNPKFLGLTLKNEKNSRSSCKADNNGDFFSKIKNSPEQFSKKSFFFIEHLIFQNFYTNLVSKSSINFLYKNHFFDTFTLVSVFYSFWPRNGSKRCIDIGSGGGFPGLPISFFFPHLFFCLLDSKSKKTKFHKTIGKNFWINNCNSICQRAEILGKYITHKEVYDYVLTRAVAELNILTRICLPLVKSNGKIIIMKKILDFNQEVSDSTSSLTYFGGKIKSLVYVHSNNQGKIIVIIKKD